MKLSTSIRRCVYAFFRLWLTIFGAAIFIAPIVHAANLDEGLVAYNAKDYKKAFELLSPLAVDGNAKAQAAIGVMYDYGQGLSKDSAKAIEWYEKAAEQGVSIVQHELGLKYFRGEGVAQDFQKAAYWWRRADEGGLSESQYRLGFLYSHGLGVEKDDSQALNWYRKAAEQGHGLAQYTLGVMYASGKGVNLDLATAAKWFRKAAEKGVSEAQYNLGVLLERGQGTRKDPEDAKRWYQLAAQQGLEQARRKLSSLENAGQQAPEAQLALATPGTFKRESWVAAQDPKRYTLQIGGGFHEQAIIAFLKGQKLGPDVAYFKREHNGKVLYTAVYGVFDSRQAARQASLSLPKGVRHSKPWIRKFAELRELISP